ncbi:acyl-CoA N-acyltransferase [Auriculariales sp. MPI-PUGE-AT-0066]|nr:acyl-CoA N-acyltransferase [Auriculariales sp. MPI-PUGE-AT-0066]
MNWTLRAATEADVETIAAIFVRGRNISLPDRRLGDEMYVWERDMAPGGLLPVRFLKAVNELRMRVAVSGDRVVAFVGLSPASASQDGRAELVYLFVEQEYQGCGIGSGLIKWALDEARCDAAASSAVLAKCFVQCLARNSSAVRAYTRAGFIKGSAESDFTNSFNEVISCFEWSEQVEVKPELIERG